MIIDYRSKSTISTINDWFKYCPPKEGKRQWIPYRSAQELAKYWTNLDKQNGFMKFLEAYDINTSEYTCYPEYETTFDDNGNGRKNDLIVIPKSDEFLLTIEAKADEGFGNKLFIDELENSIKVKKEKTDSNKLDRLMRLYSDYFCYNQSVLNVPYQLTYWFAGSIAEALRRKIKVVILIVQEFRSNSLNEKKLILNKRHLDLFASIITKTTITEINENQIHGPIENEYTKGIRLYIGKKVELLT